MGGLQAEGYGYVHSRFDGLAAERGRFVAPLANCIRSCCYEKRRPSHLVNVLNVSVAVNNHVQLDHAFDALALGVFGIYRFDTREQLAHLQTGALLRYLRFHLGRNAD